MITFDSVARAAPESIGAASATPPTPATEPAAAAAAFASNQREVDRIFAPTAIAPSGGAASELLQIVGQVVADRATQAGWSILEQKIKTSLDCEEKVKTYPSTCKVLNNVRVQDLLSSPRVMLDAAMTDFAAIWGSRLTTKLNAPPALKYAVEVAVGTTGVVALWGGSQKNAAFAVVLEQLRTQLHDLAGAACPSENPAWPLDLPSMRAAYGVAMCLAQRKEDTAKERVAACELPTVLATCGADDAVTMATATGLKAALSAERDLDMFEGVAHFITHGAAERLRLTRAKDEPRCFAKDGSDPDLNLCAALVEDVGEVVMGLTRQDWTRVSSGAVAVLDDYRKLAGETVSGSRFFQLLASMGQYALTYKTSNDPVNEGASQARHDIIESLVKQMTNRDDRAGWVFSVGGSLGAGYMHRKEFDGDTKGTSVFALPLGLGVQYYPQSSNVGFHAQAGIFDLGQYVTFEDNHTATVGTPDVKAAIALSLSVGVWTPWLSKSTPIFIGPYGGVAPFVLANGKPEYFIGGMVGAYIPLLDF